MTDTLFDATYQVARNLGIVSEGYATGGSTTTLIDTDDLTQEDDYWNGGTVWVLRDAAGAGAAPEKEFSVVDDFVNSTKTATLRSTLTEAIVTGDKYAIGKARYPLYKVLIWSVNEALKRMGVIPFTDKTTLDTAASQTEYTLPSAANFDLRQVWIQGRTGDANDNQWIEIRDAEIEHTGTGSGDILIISQLPTARDIKLVYMARHPELHDADDQINESVHIDRVVYGATVQALLWRKQKVGSGDPTLNEQLNFYREEENKAAARYPIPPVRRKARLNIIDQFPSVENLKTPGT